MRVYPQLPGPRNRQIVRDVLVLLALVLVAVLAALVHRAVMSLTVISEGFTSNAQGAQDAWTSLGDSLAGIPFVGDDLERTVDSLAQSTFGNAAQTGQTVTDAVTTAAAVLALVTFAAPAAVVLVLWLPRRLDRARRWDAAVRVLSAIPVEAGGGGLLVEPGWPILSGGDAHGSLGGSDRIGPGPERDWEGSGSATPGAAPGGPAAGGPGAPGIHDTVALPWPSDPAAGGSSGHVLPRPAAPGPAHRAGPSSISFPADELLALRALCHLPLADLLRYSPRPFEAFEAGDYGPLVAALYASEGVRPPA